MKQQLCNFTAFVFNIINACMFSSFTSSAFVYENPGVLIYSSGLMEMLTLLAVNTPNMTHDMAALTILVLLIKCAGNSNRQLIFGF